MTATTRLKLVVNTVKREADQNGDIVQEHLTFSAVYSDKEGAANKAWCKWTPSAQLSFAVSNPAVFGKILPGQFYYADLILTDKESL
jgi:hypothetical protein